MYKLEWRVIVHCFWAVRLHLKANKSLFQQKSIIHHNDVYVETIGWSEKNHKNVVNEWMNKQSIEQNT